MKAARGAYAHRLDAAFWAYIDAVNAAFPADVATLPLAEQRRLYDAMCQQFHPGRPPEVAADDVAIDVQLQAKGGYCDFL